MAKRSFIGYLVYVFCLIIRIYIYIYIYIYSDFLTLKMTHTENSLSRLNKDDSICLELDYQQKYDITLDKSSKELANLHKSYNKLKSDLAITKGVNESFRNQILTLERLCWRNAQFFRQEIL